MGRENKAEGLLGQKICGIPLPLFMGLSIVIWVIGFSGKLPNSVFATLMFLWSLGMFLQWLGSNTPVLGKYIGFGGILPLFGASILVTVGLIDEGLKLQCKEFVSSNIQPVLVGVLLCGAILGRLDGNTLRKAALRYIPVILIGQTCALGGCYLVGKLMGYNVFESVILVAFPCFSGGSGGPLNNIPPAITSAMGIDGTQFVGYMMAGASLANVEAILMCAVLDAVGKGFPAITGNGNLIRSKTGEIKTEQYKIGKFDGNLINLLRAIFLVGFMVVISTLIASVMKPIINLNYLVYLILILIVLKLGRMLPQDWEESMAHLQSFISPLFLPALIAGMGIGSIDLVETFSALTPGFFLLVTVTVVCFVAGSMLGGFLLGMYPVEAGISVGCCSCNIGGTGDIICFETAKRMTLYPFASLSTRIGGAIALLELGLLLPFVQL